MRGDGPLDARRPRPPADDFPHALADHREAALLEEEGLRLVPYLCQRALINIKCLPVESLIEHSILGS
jgi:hypothetical protein